MGCETGAGCDLGDTGEVAALAALCESSGLEEAFSDDSSLFRQTSERSSPFSSFSSSSDGSSKRLSNDLPSSTALGVAFLVQLPVSALASWLMSIMGEVGRLKKKMNCLKFTKCGDWFREFGLCGIRGCEIWYCLEKGTFLCIFGDSRFLQFAHKHCLKQRGTNICLPCVSR